MKTRDDRADRRDEIDRIVDDILADPSRAAELKRLLRRRLARRRTGLRLVAANHKADPDDLWDNVPV